MICGDYKDWLPAKELRYRKIYDVACAVYDIAAATKNDKYDVLELLAEILSEEEIELVKKKL